MKIEQKVLQFPSGAIVKRRFSIIYTEIPKMQEFFNRSLKNSSAMTYILFELPTVIERSFEEISILGNFTNLNTGIKLGSRVFFWPTSTLYYHFGLEFKI